MVSHKIISKFLIIGLLIFLLLNTSSLGFYQYKFSGNSRQEPMPHVFGEMGENQWFVSAVTISFDYEPAKVKEIQYYLDGGWHVYSDPFNVVEDGVYFIQWFWVETSGRPHNGLPIQFKIDKTQPTIQLTKKSSGKETVIFTATAEDSVSQIERVEFYLDGVLQQTSSEIPYEYSWTGEEKQIVYAIAYNYAGLSEKSNNLSTTPKPHLRNHYFMQRFFILIQAMLLRFY